MNGNKGYTLVEMVITMVIFVVVIGLGTQAFNRIIMSSAQQTKSIESNIEGVLGLDVMRRDIQQAGLGLPWTFRNYSAVPAYKECDVAVGWQAKGIDSTIFNDVIPDAPRALLSSTATKEVNGISSVPSGSGPDYLVVKSAVVAVNNTVKRWSYVNYSSSNKSYINSWGTADDIINGDRVITIKSTFSANGGEDKILVVDDAAFYYEVNGSHPPNNFQPGDKSELFIIYGINGNQDLKIPYNRADFYINKPGNLPAICNQNTGILYKAVANHSDDGFTEYPLLDCVGDMQVEFETPNGFIDSTISKKAYEIREEVKSVLVYILAQDGKKDPGFTYPISDVNNVIQVGDKRRPSSGRIWTAANMQTVFGTDWRNYHWKVYTLAVRPSTLN